MAHLFQHLIPVVLVLLMVGLIGSAAFSRATAAPVTHQRPSDDSGYVSIVPAMTVCVPGVQPLTFGCNHAEGGEWRFSWSAVVPIISDPPAYLLSAADWLTLAQTFGLDAQLHDITKHA